MSSVTQSSSPTPPAEEILEADRAICDPHHHYWHHPKRPYLLEDLHGDTSSGHNVVSTVFVDCGAEYRTDGPEALRPVGETEFITEAAKRSETSDEATIAAIVSFADLALGDDVEEVLAAHVAAAEGRFRGIRHVTSWDASPDLHPAHTNPPQGLMGHDNFRAGFDVLGRMGLSFDAWLYHPQLSELVDLAREHPETTVILDHLGGPVGIGPYQGMRDEVLAATQEPLRQLAEMPQVYMKVGGIGMSLFGDAWNKMEQRPTSDQLVERWGDHLNWIIDTFGPERCMFESNFPVDKIGIDYAVLWNAFKKMSAHRSDAEKTWLFHDAAAAAYRLPAIGAAQ
ncbi:MAG: L-fuconolactonase [Acidimicrobiales bacterium]|jgi:L-fuconolactonase